MGRGLFVGDFVGRKALLLLAPLAGLVPLLLATAQPATASAPVNTAIPTISGTAKVQQTLTAAPGTWSGSPTPTYAYQWERCENNYAPGVDWTTRTAPSSYGWRSVVWGVNKFVAVGGDVGESTADDVLMSPD
ncbi:MAG: hypothetical protein FGM38_03810, partial [Solirubrobacterales bacterium]|nr:hypothetical protein [Solirubrobacterales bacterium]